MSQSPDWRGLVETDQEVSAANHSSAVLSVNHFTTTNGLPCSWARVLPPELCSQRVKLKIHYGQIIWWLHQKQRDTERLISPSVLSPKMQYRGLTKDTDRASSSTIFLNIRYSMCLFILLFFYLTRIATLDSLDLFLSCNTESK